MRRERESVARHTAKRPRASPRRAGPLAPRVPSFVQELCVLWPGDLRLRDGAASPVVFPAAAVCSKRSRGSGWVEGGCHRLHFPLSQLGRRRTGNRTRCVRAPAPSPCRRQISHDTSPRCSQVQCCSSRALHPKHERSASEPSRTGRQRTGQAVVVQVRAEKKRRAAKSRGEYMISPSEQQAGSPGPRAERGESSERRSEDRAKGVGQDQQEAQLCCRCRKPFFLQWCAGVLPPQV